jgi:demethylmenaquinone methyltransferase/2-methoxy-6-polyprenyl-1,4-benzoquinol methylase
VLPRLAGLITGDRTAYEYLGRTIGEFPGREHLGAEFRAGGFSAVTATGLSFGIVALHEAAV